jgi:hypothetical protein
VAEPVLSIERPSPEPEDPEEGFQPSDLPYFKDEFFEVFGNTSNYECQKKPLVPITLSDPLDEPFHKESINELIVVMSSNGWKRESTLLKKFRFVPLLQPSVAKFSEQWWMYFFTHYRSI